MMMWCLDTRASRALCLLVLSACSGSPNPVASSPLPAEGAPNGALARPAPSGGTAPAGSESRARAVTYDRHSFMIGGERVWLWSGEFHYFRLPNPDLWRDQLEKFKASGLNAVSLYFSWAYHSPAPGVYDFTGVRDIDRLLDIAEQVGLYVIARPGPYINAELDSGGFPGWLITQRGQARTASDDYQAAWEQWFDQLNAIIARHQVTNGGGTVVLYQVENEFDLYDPVYMEELKTAVRADGITVPLFHNDLGRNLRWSSGPGAPDLYGADHYPAGFDCNRKTVPAVSDYRFLRNGVGERPLIFAEFQGGAFDPWGGAGYERCRVMTGPSFERLSYGNNIENAFTLHNIYMAHGGTNWGWQADPHQVYTSYDYGSAFSEERELTDKVPVLKQQGYMLASVADLRKTDDVGPQASTNPAVRVWLKQNPDSGARFYFIRHADSTAVSNDSTTFAIDARDGSYKATVQIDGADFKILSAGYDMARQRLVYSTSEIMTQMDRGDLGDVALLHGRAGEPGEALLRYGAEPRVDVLAGDVKSTWDATRGDLRLSYVHRGLAQVRISEGGRPPLELLLADGDAAARFWRLETSAGPVLVRGPYLVRSATQSATSLFLRGDTDRAGPLTVYARSDIRELFWNGQQVTAGGTLAGPRAVTLPALNRWRYLRDVPEVAPTFDDSSWVAADHTSTNNPTPPARFPVLYTDDYGFHYGDVWYRGRFNGAATGISLAAGTGRAGIWSAWANGVHLGTVNTGTAAGNQSSTASFTFPRGLVAENRDNVVSVLVRNMGHNEDFFSNDTHKSPRGLLAASLVGSDAAVSFRIQGARGGENLADVLRGPQNNGGLNGERVGYALPGFADESWASVSLPHREKAAGIAWYRTTVQLALPKDQDVPVGLRFKDNPARHYRALIFVNGWNVGQYINDVGPQRVFVLPEGILNHQGENTLALAVWSADATSGGLGQLSLEALGNYTTPPR